MKISPDEFKNRKPEIKIHRTKIKGADFIAVELDDVFRKEMLKLNIVEFSYWKRNFIGAITNAFDTMDLSSDGSQVEEPKTQNEKDIN